jgi:general secretion pathway protein E
LTCAWATDIDVRVSTIPTPGERLVLRLLNKSGSLLELTDLGLSQQRLQMVQKLVSSPNGIVLVTGPTGSGKTTTLYAILTSINKPNINIITIEDPIEYQIKGISQIQVNPKIDLTFARGLRSIVRQDRCRSSARSGTRDADIAVQSPPLASSFDPAYQRLPPSAITGWWTSGLNRSRSPLEAGCPAGWCGASCALTASSLTGSRRLLQHPVQLSSYGKPIYKATGCEVFPDGLPRPDRHLEIMVMSDELKTLFSDLRLQPHQALAVQEKMIPCAGRHRE